MNKIRRVLRTSFISGLIMVLVGVFPVPAFALDSTNDTSQPAAPTTSDQQPAGQTDTNVQPSQPVPKPATGTDGPTGVASGTYQYNANTGLWENDYYTYNPVTKETVPKTPLEYTYNAATGLWDTYIWQYVTSQGKYEQQLVSVTAPPAGAITHGGPADTTPPSNQQSTGTNTDSSNGPTNVTDTATAAGPATSVTTGSSNETTNKSQQDGISPTNLSVGADLNFANSGTITNFQNDTARSGNAIIIANTTAGNATSGNATDVTNIMNLLQSQAALAGPNVATFTANIQGNVSGDFLIDPTSLAQPAAVNPNDLTRLTVNGQDNGTINNTINLDARSGDATAARNTKVGDITTGNANAVANVINMINSVVAANQSFMGVINIYGDYAGNILMPQDSLNALLASSGAIPANTDQTAQANVTTSSNQNITNNVDLSAASGAASASQNTKVGNVTSGNGLTNLTILNLTGRQVVAANSLLVFVNVLGSWVGLIMDAPAGSTSASLGGGVASDGTLPEQTNINSASNFGINNAITANAVSGNVSATENTSAGNVRSGNATASANIANVIGSSFSLSNWFGILFINVFGTWHGNFGVAKPPVIEPITSGLANAASGSSPDVASGSMRVFAFTPHQSSGSGGLGLSPLSQANQDSSVTSGEIMKQVSQVLGASHTVKPQTASVAQQKAAANNWLTLLFLALGTIGLTGISLDRIRSQLRNRSASRR